MMVITLFLMAMGRPCSSHIWFCAFAAQPARRQVPAGTSGLSHQYPRPVPPSRQTQGEQDFDPNILSSLVGGLNPLQMLGPAPSFAPDIDEPSHKRTHEQMQQLPQVSLVGFLFSHVPLPLHVCLALGWICLSCIIHSTFRPPGG